MRWKREIKNDGYRRWFAIIPFYLDYGPYGVWVWWEWYESRFDGMCISIRLLPKDESHAG